MLKQKSYSGLKYILNNMWLLRCGFLGQHSGVPAPDAGRKTPTTKIDQLWLMDDVSHRLSQTRLTLNKIFPSVIKCLVIQSAVRGPDQFMRLQLNL